MHPSNRPLPAPNAMPSPCLGPVTLTGARLGLTFAMDGATPLLVPAWLFDVKGSDQPLVAVAIEPAYLAPPEPSGGSGSGAPSTGGGSTGREPAPPGIVDPVPASSTPGPVSPPAGPSEPQAKPVPVVEALISSDGRTLTLLVEAPCNYPRTAAAGEDTHTVKVLVSVTPQYVEPNFCPRPPKVRLDAPLGDRTVVDATSGNRVPVRRAP